MAKNPAFNLHVIASGENYQHTAEAVSFLIFWELKKAEAGLDALKSGAHPSKVLTALPRLVSMVNMMGYFRGQDDAFLEIRPKGPAVNQAELYRAEKKYEKMLRKIITRLYDAGHGDECHACLEQYYVK